MAFLLLTSIALSLAAGSRAQGFPDCVNGPLASNPVCDASLGHVERARALVEEFTVPEMINNTVNAAFGVPRLGLPPYEWWNEALHGVGLSPGVVFFEPEPAVATSFPMPINMGSAFDDALMLAMGDVISTEARAFSNAGRAGLDYWTPNINPFKDPRWGRGAETPGEDPLHAARYVRSLVEGLQGGIDPPSLKVAAACKHWAAYDLENWGGVTRYAFDAVVTPQDLAEYYAPPFRSCVRDARAASAMCSYNAVNGVPACASPYLLKTVLRDAWGLAEDRWVTSDCGAVGNVYDPHGYTEDLVNASTVSLKAGTDLNCGTNYTQYLPEAYDRGLIDEDDLKAALTRLYASLVWLGYFDAPEDQPYRQITWADVNTPEAQALAYTAAIKSFVLLKNDGTLPLTDSTLSLALIGPMANASALQMLGNYFGIPPFVIAPLQGFLDAGFNVTYVLGTNVTGNDAGSFDAAVAAAEAADVVIYVGGIDNTLEMEEKDRTEISWPDNQLALLSALEGVGKPLVVVQMGGGQLDDTPLKESDAVNAILWAGYPGQSGGTAIADTVTGKVAPAGRLYVDEVAMTDMTLRPDNATGNPGRTYKWYTGTPVYPYGYGLHYTNISVAWASDAPEACYSIQDLTGEASGFVDLAPLDTFRVTVTNEGDIASDFVALLFVSTQAGPAPAPIKEMVAYARASDVQPGNSTEVELEVTLGALARTDESGDASLYPGKYELTFDYDGALSLSFELCGDAQLIAEWPADV
ncbi:glycoside hydrolase family 3 protein [Schizophyllum commune H4-8]|uniref:xylan 1,4-beta-xylosidase n=1 Tax=Schizophyllum commune (strain H4-8 / FGSC 9210) TaxID=578458 RepID=D8Q6Q7_SCHCM|nr:glycoside hydrolase family 3 protein [Schizophyllum commune H4-8]KAI5891827.1 glycoside hydrolase family 3 protein [Schizophyllum commune H4-8]